MYRKLVRAFAFCIIGTCALAPIATATQCGDADGDGTATVADIIYAMQYIYHGGPAPADFSVADYDRHVNLTVSDMTLLFSTALGCDIWDFATPCPPDQSPLVPPVDTAFKFVYTNRFPGATTTSRIDLKLLTPGGSRIMGMSAPIKIRVGGQIPVIDSVRYPLASSRFSTAPSLYSVDYDSGTIAFGGLSYPNYLPTKDEFARVYLSMPSSASERQITIEWVTLTPAQAPTADNSIIPMLVGFCGDGAKEPKLAGSCCLNAGDANNDGMVNISDAVYIIQWIFIGLPGSGLCLDQFDANGDGMVNVSDVVYLLSFIFTGGGAPVCGTSGMVSP